MSDKPTLVPVTDKWLEHAIAMRFISVRALGADHELLSALVELRDRRRASWGGKGAGK